MRYTLLAATDLYYKGNTLNIWPMRLKVLTKLCQAISWKFGNFKFQSCIEESVPSVTCTERKFSGGKLLHIYRNKVVPCKSKLDEPDICADKPCKF